MAFSFSDFIQNQSINLLKPLQHDQKALWGQMGAQQMVEHISGIFYLSRKDLGIPCAIPENKLEKIKRFLWNDRVMSKHFFIEGVHPAKPVELRFENLDQAKDMFKKSIADFYEFYAKNPNAKLMHPVFGELNFEEWERFHYKHITHHFTQFGLIEEQEKLAMPQ